jgi:GT2 family glycosyltransferase/glycosyltransferase involved in cell wall biosynthesis
VCVDNGSTDGSREFLASRFPQVHVVALPENRGFTGGNNAGVAQSHGAVLVFFNNDMRVEPATLRALVTALDEDYPCAAAEVRSWNGRRIDFVCGSLNFEAHGFQDHYGEVWRAERATAQETFFPNGGAFAITRAAYLAAGGFDDLYFAYYDDVDLGFGVRLNGGRVRVVRGALVYHRHGATSRRYPMGQKRFLMERNALCTVLKRYETSSPDRALGAVLLLAAGRIMQETVLRRRTPWVRSLAAFSSRCRTRAPVAPAVPASHIYEPLAARAGSAPVQHEDAKARVLDLFPLESLAAVGEALRGLPQILEKRRASEDRRVLPDGAVFSAMGRPLAYGSPLASYQASHDALVETLRLAEVFRSRPRVLLLTHEPLRRLMSGPGVRVIELGRALATSVRVTIASPAEPEIADDRCAIVGYSADRPSTLRRLANDADVLLVQGFALTQFPFLTAMHVPIVVDLYCPFTIEYLELKAAEARAHGAAAPDIDGQLEAVSILEVQNAQLRHGDFFICASERQRDFWLGALHSSNRVNTQTYATDPSLRRLIDVVPFGVPPDDFEDAAGRAHARAGGSVLKGVRPGIKGRDHVLFWGGSLLDWQDPLTLIRAVARLARVRDDVKVFFAGTRHPNPQVAPMQVVAASMTLARDLGVLDTHVFFNDWVPYEERAAYLQEADLGLSTHRLHLETHLSFRTRMLDYIWAALPIICTEGDFFADLVASRGLGLVVPPEDDAALATAIARLLDDRELREQSRDALRVVAGEMRWRRVAEPLRRFVASPRFAADREPAIRTIRVKLRNSYRASKWVKRTALRLGVSEGGFEQIKSLAPVRVAIRLRNQMALSRAGRLRR